jgi:predicted O-methyltransferase YrrM
LAAYPAFWHGTSSEQDLRALYILCRALKPRVIIETGVSSGASAFILLTALQKNGQGELYSIDLSPTVWGAALPNYREKDKINLPPEKSVGWLVPESLKSRWHLIVGDSRKELPQILQHVGACDFFYHDAEHTYEAMAWEYETVWPKISSGGVLTSDDVHWSKAFAEFIRTKSDIRKAHAWRGFGMIRKR